MRKNKQIKSIQEVQVLVIDSLKRAINYYPTTESFIGWPEFAIILGKIKYISQHRDNLITIVKDITKQRDDLIIMVKDHRVRERLRKMSFKCRLKFLFTGKI